MLVLAALFSLFIFLFAALHANGYTEQNVKNFSYCLSCVTVHSSENSNLISDDHCRETLPTELPGRHLVPIYYCSSGACVKIKGTFQDEIYVVRECWDRLWDRPIKHGWQGCSVVDFMYDSMAHICVCLSNDLCNSALKIGSGQIYLLLLLFMPLTGLCFFNQILF
ncbi:Receptor-like protein [Trichinella spiralis]|uniref:Receptor-like protein n=1 Tax=Trichinella spiralis TaxID=6334 RepID=A0ABR3KB64_TRISP